MIAHEQVLARVLHSGDQYVIPLFQRYYEWKLEHWERLWLDIDDLTEEGSTKLHHFLGSVVCVADRHEPGAVHRYMVIDGQQRLLTLAILLCVVRDLALQHGQDKLALEIEDNFLLHRHKQGNERYRVIPRQRDRLSFLNLVDRMPVGESTRVVEAYEFFKRGVSADAASEDRLRQFFTAISERLMLVVITLDPSENAFAIFKSLNSTGCTIEHVMPQTINDDDDGLKWKTALGPDWRRVHDGWLNTIGNLTLVGYDYNIQMRNKPFEEKKRELLRSKVYLNEHFVPLPEWNENLIAQRGDALAKQLVAIWEGPS
jgi:hypothetical protein